MAWRGIVIIIIDKLNDVMFLRRTLKAAHRRARARAIVARIGVVRGVARRGGLVRVRRKCASGASAASYQAQLLSSTIGGARRILIGNVNDARAYRHIGKIDGGKCARPSSSTSFVNNAWRAARACAQMKWRRAARGARKSGARARGSAIVVKRGGARRWRNGKTGVTLARLDASWRWLYHLGTAAALRLIVD